MGPGKGKGKEIEETFRFLLNRFRKDEHEQRIDSPGHILVLCKKGLSHCAMRDNPESLYVVRTFLTSLLLM